MYDEYNVLDNLTEYSISLSTIANNTEMRNGTFSEMEEWDNDFLDIAIESENLSMSRDLDTVNDILSALDPEIYELTRISAEEYYGNGNSALLPVASEKSGLTIEEILWLW